MQLLAQNAPSDLTIMESNMIEMVSDFAELLLCRILERKALRSAAFYEADRKSVCTDCCSEQHEGKTKNTLHTLTCKGPNGATNEELKTSSVREIKEMNKH